MNLDAKQTAMRLKNGEYPDLAEGKVRLSMWLLLEANPNRSLASLGRRFGRTKRWTAAWVARGCPLMPFDETQ